MPTIKQHDGSTQRRLARLILALGAIAILVPHTTAATADQNELCGEERITARGETSRFDWIARLKTRANWRSKIRAMPDLGDRYANWYRAKEADENCASGPAGTVCTFSGIPCRKE